MSFKQPPQRQPRPPIPCAWGECENMVERGQEYSFIISFATRGPDSRTGSFNCPDEDEVKQNPDAQHFCCSPECAAKCAHACIDEHLVPRHHAHVAWLTDQDAALAAEQAAMEAHRQELAQKTAGSGPFPALPPGAWVDPAAVAQVQAALHAVPSQEPAGADAPTPSVPTDEIVTQVVQQDETPDAAPEPPPPAEPAQEAAPDDGPPTLLAIPVIASTPDKASSDASEGSAPVTHDTQPAESEASSDVPASSDSQFSQESPHDPDATGPSGDSATASSSAAVATEPTSEPGSADASPDPEGVRGGSEDGDVADRRGDGDDQPPPDASAEPADAATEPASEPEVAQETVATEETTPGTDATQTEAQ